MPPQRALHLQHVLLPGPWTHSVTGTSGEAQWVLWWLPSLGRVLQHPRLSRAGWEGTAASGLAGNHRKHRTTELISISTRGSSGVKITLEKQSQSPVMESLTARAVSWLAWANPRSLPSALPARSIISFAPTSMMVLPDPRSHLWHIGEFIWPCSSLLLKRQSLPFLNHRHCTFAKGGILQEKCF